jgi:hypothetical protein
VYCCLGSGCAGAMRLSPGVHWRDRLRTSNQFDQVGTIGSIQTWVVSVASAFARERSCASPRSVRWRWLRHHLWRAPWHSFSRCAEAHAHLFSDWHPELAKAPMWSMRCAVASKVGTRERSQDCTVGLACLRGFHVLPTILTRKTAHCSHQPRRLDAPAGRCCRGSRQGALQRPRARAKPRH